MFSKVAGVYISEPDVLESISSQQHVYYCNSNGLLLDLSHSLVMIACFGAKQIFISGIVCRLLFDSYVQAPSVYTSRHRRLYN